MISDGVYNSRRFIKSVLQSAISGRALRVAGVMAKKDTRGVWVSIGDSSLET